ncbi:MAG: enoyl-CoA hydratase/isomerase family protein [Candidatus Binatia bacterium]
MGAIERRELDGATVLTFARPPVNALDLTVSEAFYEALVAAEAAGRPLVLTGAGTCFSAGIDTKRIPAYPPAEQQRMIDTVNRTLRRLHAFPAPVVAAVNGHALGGGLVVALACDFRIVAAGALRLGLTEVTAGVPFPAAGLLITQTALAPATVRQLVLSGRVIGPEEAVALGVADEVAAPDAVVTRAVALAAQLAAASAYTRVKAQLRADVLARIDHVVAAGDPLLAGWLASRRSP